MERLDVELVAKEDGEGCGLKEYFWEDMEAGGLIKGRGTKRQSSEWRTLKTWTKLESTEIVYSDD